MKSLSRSHFNPSGSRRGLRAITVAALLFIGIQLPAFSAVPLTEPDFRQIGEQGFGDNANGYAWSMAEFKGKIYIGTNHNFLCLIQNGVASPGTGQNPEIPGDCAENLLENDLRARIYEYDPKSNQVNLVFISPTFRTLLSDGTRFDAPRASGYRTSVVFREPDGTEALYIGTFTSSEVPGIGARILRTTDGRNFTEVPLNFPKSDEYRSFRALTVFKNKLYVLGLTSDSTAPVLFESTNPATGGFVIAAEGGFGDPINLGAFDMGVFKGYLYVGTFAVNGFQLLKTKAEGIPPYEFEKVLVEGAYRGIKNQSVLSLHPFRDHLYVGTGVYFGSVSLIPDFQPSPAEVLRVKADDTWEIVVGEERQTPDGFKEPISNFPPGFGNPFVGYMWRMIEHQGNLYLGTLDTSVLAQYAEDIDPAAIEEHIDLSRYPNLAALLELYGPDEIADLVAAVEGGFDLWTTADGEAWRIVSFTGFGDSFAYGIRSFVSSKLGLYIGTANPFTGMRMFLGQPQKTDSDGDSFADEVDNCPVTWNLSQNDLDKDGIGDDCDDDTDGDCILDAVDQFARIADLNLADADRDGIPDACDSDDDEDSVLDVQDNCRLIANFGQDDADADGLGDACESAAPQTPDPNNPNPDAENPETPVDPDDGGVTEPQPEAPLPTPAACGVLGLIPLLMLLPACCTRVRKIPCRPRSR